MVVEEHKVYSFEEVAKHSNIDDCWLIISGKVYDITPFMGAHPGGDDVLMFSTGKDATDDFEDVGHSKTARDTMSMYYKGDLDPTTFPSNPSQIPTSIATMSSENAAHSSFKIMPQLLAVLVLGLAFFVHLYASGRLNTRS